MGTARRTSRRFIDVTRLRPDAVLASLRDPGVLINIGLRIAIVAFTIDALINAADPRFAGKALGPRNVGIVGNAEQIRARDRRKHQPTEEEFRAPLQGEGRATLVAG